MVVDEMRSDPSERIVPGFILFHRNVTFLAQSISIIIPFCALPNYIVFEVGISNTNYLPIITKLLQCLCFGDGFHDEYRKNWDCNAENVESASTCHGIHILDFSVETSYFPTHTNTLIHLTLKLTLGDSFVRHRINTTELENLEHVTVAQFHRIVINNHGGLTVDLRDCGELHRVFP